MMFNPMQLMGLLQNSQNPSMLMESLMAQNPLLSRAMQMGQGKNPQELAMIARNLAKQQGMNDQQFARLLSQFGISGGF